MFIDLLKVCLGFLLGCGIALFIIWIKDVCSRNTLSGKFDSYPIDKVDVGKMTVDKIENNLSAKQVQRNIVNGKYDKR